MVGCLGLEIRRMVCVSVPEFSLNNWAAASVPESPLSTAPTTPL